MTEPLISLLSTVVDLSTEDYASKALTTTVTSVVKKHFDSLVQPPLSPSLPPTHTHTPLDPLQVARKQTRYMLRDPTWWWTSAQRSDP